MTKAHRSLAGMATASTSQHSLHLEAQPSVGALAFRYSESSNRKVRRDEDAPRNTTMFVTTVDIGPGK